MTCYQCKFFLFSVVALKCLSHWIEIWKMNWKCHCNWNDLICEMKKSGNLTMWINYSLLIEFHGVLHFRFFSIQQMLCTAINSFLLKCYPWFVYSNWFQFINFSYSLQQKSRDQRIWIQWMNINVCHLMCILY